MKDSAENKPYAAAPSLGRSPLFPGQRQEKAGVETSL